MASVTSVPGNASSSMAAPAATTASRQPRTAARHMRQAAARTIAATAGMIPMKMRSACASWPQRKYRPASATMKTNAGSNAPHTQTKAPAVPRRR